MLTARPGAAGVWGRQKLGIGVGKGRAGGWECSQASPRVGFAALGIFAVAPGWWEMGGIHYGWDPLWMGSPHGWDFPTNGIPHEWDFPWIGSPCGWDFPTD